MTRDEATQATWKAYRLGKAGLTQDEFAAVLEIARLNRRYVRAHERENGNDGNEPATSRATRALETSSGAARDLAAQHEWKIDMSGGLWWSLHRTTEVNIHSGYPRANLLSGLLA